VEISFTGVAGHAGTVPMPMRRDALAGAAEFITAVESYALTQNGAIVATTGTIRVHDGATNVIAGKVTCSLDLRSGDSQLLSAAYAHIQQLAESISHKRNIELQWKLLQQTDPLQCDEQLTGILGNAIAACGFEVIELVSGAGHDAVPVAAVSPVAMLFVKCFEGISHNPLEKVEVKDIQHAIEVGDVFLKNLIQQYAIKHP
jgi:allantoate deiminase